MSECDTKKDCIRCNFLTIWQEAKTKARLLVSLIKFVKDFKDILSTWHLRVPTPKVHSVTIASEQAYVFHIT